MMERALAKLRGHVNGSLGSTARLLEAVETTISPARTPAAYYHALTATLAASTGTSIADDAAYLLAIVIPALSNDERSQQATHILAIPTDNTRTRLALQLAIYQQPPSQATTANLRTNILPLLTHPQPKTRRAAHSFLTQAIATHPQPITSHTLQQLARPLQPAITISLLKFTQAITTHFDDHQALIQHLSNIPNTTPSQPFLAATIYETYQAILNNNKLSTPLIIAIINQLTHHTPISHPEQLNALQLAWTQLDPKTSSAELARIGKLEPIFQNFASPDQPTRAATEALLSAIAKYSISDQDILSPDGSLHLILKAVLDGLHSTELIAVGGTVELINLLKTLATRLARNHQPSSSTQPAAQLIKQHILALDKLRRTRLGLTPTIDHCLGAISQSCGPRFLLDILPLNLALENDDEQEEGRAWLLTLIKPFNTDLKHFITHFVPLSERLFEKKRNALKQATHQNQKNALIQSKIYDTLIEQIWRLLPGYCDLPWDLAEAFDRPFAELLTQVIYSQPSLRPPILNSLKLLIDKTLVLANRNATEFGFDPHAHLNHLKTFAPNFLSVLFNVYNSSYDPSEHPSANSNRGYMVDCMRSLLEILSDKELNESYQKIKALLDQSISTAKSTVTTQKMLDLLTILLPRLVTSTEEKKEGRAERLKRLQEIHGLISQDQFILSADANLQKKSFKLLATFLDLLHQHGLVKTAVADLDGLINKLLGLDGKGKVSGPAKRDRALLVSSLVSVIPVDKLHHIPRLLTEVVLGCKEANTDVRGQSYEVLIKIGHKMKEHGGKVNWKALVDGLEDQENDENAIMDDGEQEASIEEYFKMISAGLAGTSPHMVSATIAALSRVLFEFHDDLSRTTIDELISTIEIFLNSPNREIAKTAIGFMKVAVVSLKKEVVEAQLEKIVPGLLKWAAEHKNYFKTNIQNLLERLLRLFGFPTLEKFVSSREENDGGRKLVNSLVKKQKKKKLARQARAENPADDDRKALDDQESDDDRPARQPRLGDAYEEALYGSESSDEDDGEQAGGPRQGSNAKHMDKKNKKNRDGGALDNQLLDDDEDQIMDLLDGGRMANRALAGKVAKAEKRKEALQRIGAGYKKDAETGKMIIESDDDEGPKAGTGGGGGTEDSTNAFLEAVHGADGFRRDARGVAKPNKKRKNHVRDDVDLDEQVEAVQGLHLTDQDSGALLLNKKKKVKRVKEKLGAEFKAKKAGGDRVARDKNGQEISPFAYLPMSALNSKKKKHAVAKNMDITGKVKGSASRS
ncbi:hypothetical protein PTTG_06335 [Puccinia triticina 1-1 BBBD Race 1]|uniref:NUC173 domain-containing protein n=1 Tax=Puccinia triticina (isolate 1-1 / race 1 (BBBD)) TaxID=630390 RepID=A0A180G827_PUCT1|nr:hypothetical protein PTTG_06335 [Puccinia triticina 1-1 BBBD Race 1]